MNETPSPVPPRLSLALAGRYAIERELGRGGMATVYLARDLRYDRAVAVKVLRPELSLGDAAERFLREIRIAARLQHPHIAAVLDSGEIAGDPGDTAAPPGEAAAKAGDTAATPGEAAAHAAPPRTHPGHARPPLLYYVMPYISGDTLRERLQREGPLAAADATRILSGVLGALAHAHAHGALHRDIKPENVILDGLHAYVLDFGIARAIDDAAGATGLTATGVSIGTPAYMAPEQLLPGEAVDARADIYAAGMLAYEMLAGRPAFPALVARLAMPAPPLEEARPDVPQVLAAFVARCLERERDARYASADDALAALQDVIQAVTAASASSAADSDGVIVEARAWRRSTVRWGTAAAVVIATVAGLMGHSMVKGERERWVHGTAIPLIRDLAEAELTDSAFVIARRAASILPGDPALEALWPLIAYTHVFHSEPAGAQVYRAPFGDTARWELVGTTPTDSVRVPREVGRYRFVLPGHRPAELLAGGYLFGDAAVTGAPLPHLVRLLPEGSADADMVFVGGPALAVGGERHRLGGFLMDRHEVTNRQFQEFVAAGGYRRRELWTEPFVLDGREIPWEQAMARFVDRTGRAGPATWEAGGPPPGTLDHPVGGVSWYEAVAYARFVGKDIPTLHHWTAAAVYSAAAWIVPGSNFESDGPRPGSSAGGMSPWGVHDIAGNVSEWCWNEGGDGTRHILGGAWNDPGYRFTDNYRLPSMDRSRTNGIRLVRHPDGDTLLAAAREPVVRASRNYADVRPVDDVVFESYRILYDYDPLPLDARVEARDTSAGEWVRETVSFAAGYGRERVRAQLFLPKHAAPPYQVVVLFPGSNGLFEPSSEATDLSYLSFLIRDGRALMLPVYKGMFERADTVLTYSTSPTIAYRDAVLAWGKDLRRAVDYVAARPDLDSSRVAYMGVSLGGRMGGVLLAVEPRFRAAVLVVAGLSSLQIRPEADPVNFLPRVRTPTLMLNGRYDDVFRLEESQRPFFRLLGTPAEHKRHMLYDDGHWIPREPFLRETLAWLDQYLGPVSR
jgi:eukaryotic-like serine/threonine-protein kinase